MRIAALIRGGELCKDCTTECRKDPNYVLAIDCALCEGEGCDDCRDGVWYLQDCPKKILDDEINTAVNYCTLADKGFLPETGGMLEQSAWFTDIYLLLQSEQAILDQQQLERISSGKR